MSLIYFALNRLDDKSDKSNSMHGDRPSEHINANEYFLPVEKTGMPLWLIVLLILSCIGVLTGWLLTRQVKEITGGQNESIYLQKVNEEKVIAPSSNSEILPKQKTEIDQFENHLVVEKNSGLPENLSGLNEGSTQLVLNTASSEIKKSEQLNEIDAAAPEVVKLVRPAKQEIASLIEIKVESNKVGAKQNTRKSNSKIDEVDKKADVEMNSQEINRLIFDIKSAVKGGKNVEADSLLSKLQLMLEPESMTLLHLQAWRQMNGGDQELSKSIYQQIITRNPEDEVAAINLAVMLWKSGKHNEAKKIIEAIAENRPDSEVVQNYRRQFGEKK